MKRDRSRRSRGGPTKVPTDHPPNLPERPWKRGRSRGDRWVVLHAVDPGRLHCAWWISATFADALRRLGGGRLPPLFLRVVEVDRSVGEAGEDRAASGLGPRVLEFALEEPSQGGQEVEGSRFLTVEGQGRFFRAELRADDSGRQVVVAGSNLVQLPGSAPARRPRAPSARAPVAKPAASPVEEAETETQIVPADAALASSREDEDGVERLQAAPRLPRDVPTVRSDEHPSPREAVGTHPDLVSEPRSAQPPTQVEGLPVLPTSSLEARPRVDVPRLEIAADIVIYGATRPGTEVVIDGEVIPVAADGTFSLRLALPGGKPRRSSEDERNPGV